MTEISHMTTDLCGSRRQSTRDYSAGVREEFNISGTQLPVHLGEYKKKPQEHPYDFSFLNHTTANDARNFGNQQSAGKALDLVGVGSLRISKFGAGTLKAFSESCFLEIHSI